jgi:2-polyprenyl-3-methyl-5-hydroxy-6-metoxy-1,4-benzoquinol methylase/spore coat polysaccharide biosynthesis predicted glycosyltransferase SpsG
MKTEKNETASKKKVLFVPRIEKGKGGGHLIRCTNTVKELRQEDIEAYVYVPNDIQNNVTIQKLFSLVTINPEWIISSCPENKKWTFIVLDNFQSSKNEFSFWTNLAPVIAFDEGGRNRNTFDFLIDVLPALSGKSKANISRPSLLPLQKNRRPQFADYSDNMPLKVLIVFGAEDAAGLGLLLAKEFSTMKNLTINLISNNSKPYEASFPQNINLIQPYSSLNETLYHYDLIITHYGITAFEAIHARVPVILASPTTYHEQLAREIGFVSLGTKKQARKKLHHHKKHFSSLMKNCVDASKKISKEQNLDFFPEQELDAEPQQNLIDFIKTIDCKVPMTCPVCRESSLHHAVIARFHDRTYRRCTSCSAEYMLRLYPPLIQYREDYFFADYKKQYGKTYLEDFPHLVEMAKGRLSYIKKLLQQQTTDKSFRLLDIGCAYGPFLQAANDEGFDVYGIDPSEEAVKYVTDTLMISAQQGFFPDAELPEHVLKDGFDVISLWYVIEHFEDVETALKKISVWLKPGGILAFSTPSGTGISARRNKKYFLENSPADHWTIWNPQNTKKILQAHRLDIKKIVVTGHHPERFPFIRKKKGLLYDFVYILSNYFKLGDTFEAYAVKEAHETWKLSR